MVQNRRKQDIIIDFGYQLTKVGVTSDKTPRKTIRSLNLFKTNQINYQWQIKMEEFLYKIFYIELNYSPADKTVIIIQNLNFKRQFLEIIVKLLFKKFDIGKVQFCLASVTPLYVTSKYSGIVINSGYNWTQIMGVYESYPLMRQFRAISIGSNSVTNNLKQKFLLSNTDFKQQFLRQDFLLDLKLIYSSLTPKKQTFILLQKIKVKVSQSWITFDQYFGDFQNQQPNIAYQFLLFLSGIDVTCLKSICSNIIFAGGLWNVKGFKTLFKNKVLELLERKEFEKLRMLNIKQISKFAQLPFNPGELSWIGSAVASALTNLQNFTIKKSDYNSQGFRQKIMQNYFLGETSDYRMKD